MLKKLYCTVRSRDFDEPFLLSIATGIPGALICKAGVDATNILSEMLQDQIVSTRTPFLIIGNVGVGKSTYLQYFFEVEIQEKKINNVIDGIIIDCRGIGDYESADGRVSLGKIINFIDRQIDNNLVIKYKEFEEPSYEIMKRIFDKEIKPESFIIQKLRKDKKDDIADEKQLNMLERLVRNKHLYNICRIRFVKRKYNKKLFLVLDNVDHLGYDLQRAIFQLSKSLIEDYHCPFILACREYTLPLAYRHMELSAFEPRFIHLTAPDVVCVIEKRKNFLLDKIKAGTLKKYLGSEALTIETALGQKKIDINQLDEILSTIIGSFLTGEILDSLKRLSNRDIRTLLKLIKIALSSGYIYPEERRVKYDTVRHYDFIRALMLGNNTYYNPKSSIIFNLFENENPRNEGNNLIRIRTLQAISTFGELAHSKDVLDFMVSIGYQKTEANELIYAFLMAGLLESPHDERINAPPFDEPNNQYSVEFLRLTQCGKYYIDYLIKEMRYLEEVKYATYIPKDVYDIIKKGLEKHNLPGVFKLTQEFLNFIGEEEKMESKKVKSIENYQKLGEPLFKTLNDEYAKSRYIVEASLPVSSNFYIEDG